MLTVRFLGSVLPVRPYVSCGEMPLVRAKGDDGLTVELHVSITKSQVIVTCDTNRLTSEDSPSLWMMANDLAKAATNVVAFATGKGLTVHLHSFEDPSGKIHTVNFSDIGLRALCTAYQIPTETPESMIEIQKICHMVFTDDTLHLALNDLVEAIAFPHAANVNCARVLDAIRNLLAPNLQKHLGWEVVRSTLHVDEPYIKFISESSKAPRHADYGYIPEAVIKKTIYRSWTLMNRFLEFRKRGNQPLPVDEFPWLSDAS
jgi:hypothetical protein